MSDDLKTADWIKNVKPCTLGRIKEEKNTIK